MPQPKGCIPWNKGKTEVQLIQYTLDKLGAKTLRIIPKDLNKIENLKFKISEFIQNANSV